MKIGQVDEEGSVYVAVVGEIKPGAGIVSGRNSGSLYGETGTIRRQIPVLMSTAAAMGKPMPEWFPDIFKGSLNVNIGEGTTFDIIKPHWDFKALTWMYFDTINPKYENMTEEELKSDSDIVRIFTALGLYLPNMSREDIHRQLHLKCENFAVIKGFIETAKGTTLPCLFYRPDPATKGSVFHGDHCFEVLALPIPAEEVAEGCLVKIILPADAIRFIAS